MGSLHFGYMFGTFDLTTFDIVILSVHHANVRHFYLEKQGFIVHILPFLGSHGERLCILI